jgi:hypothetical protein
MDFSKLDQNEKMAFGGAVVVFLAGIISNWGGLFWLAVLAALGMAAVILLPQVSPSTTLPGSKGTLMATLGFVAVGTGVIELLRYIGYFLDTLGRLSTIAFGVALAGAVVMALAGWRELQKEGGKWRFGMAGPAAAPAAADGSAPAPAVAASAADAPVDAPSSVAATTAPAEAAAADAAADTGPAVADAADEARPPA